MKMHSIAGLVAGAALALSAASAEASSLFQTFSFSGTNVAVNGEFEFDSALQGDLSHQLVNIQGTQTLGATSGAITGLSTYAGADNHYFPAGPPFFTFAGVSWYVPSIGAGTHFNVYYDGSGHFELASSESINGFPDGLHPLTSMSVGAITESSTFNAVPEPSAWALMILGFGGVGAVIRKRASSLAAA